MTVCEIRIHEKKTIQYKHLHRWDVDTEDAA